MCMEVRRTVPVKLDVTDDQADLLHETIDEFLWAANYVVDAAWDGEWAETRSSVLGPPRTDLRGCARPDAPPQ